MSLISLVLAGSIFLILYYLVPFQWTYHELKRIPAPFPAQLSNFWLLYVCRTGKRYQFIDAVHDRLGPVVRIQPNHVSIADEKAIPLVYGHGNGLLKSPWYDAFVSIGRSIFNTRDRAEHARKRRIVSHTFAPKSVRHMEPYVRERIKVLIEKWDQQIDKGCQSDGFTKIECRQWFNFLAFDIIGDLAFGAPFGMLEAGKDRVEVRTSFEGTPTYLSAVECLTRRSEIAATLGVIPELKPYAKFIPDPFFHRGVASIEGLTGIAIARVKDQIENPPKIARRDLLSLLKDGVDEEGKPFGLNELTAEALTLLIAGSDTTSNTFCAMMYHLASTPRVLKKLRLELDTAIPTGIVVPEYDTVKGLPYLNNVVNETLRHHSTIGLGLPRQVPFDSTGVHFEGYYFPPGTVLSVPSYTLHHSKEIWGIDANEYRPERWETVTDRQKNAFIPFSYGPRACVGRNLAEMEMKVLAATWARRYDFCMKQEEEVEIREGLTRKPVAVQVGIRLRRMVC